MNSEDFRREREELVKHLIEEGVISSEKVKNAMLNVPRELFVPRHYKMYAYEDHPLPIPSGQTISAPHMCAIICEALDIDINDSILEIGTGSGYNIALCTEIAASNGVEIDNYIVSIEIFKELAIFAKENLKKSGHYEHVNIVVSDGSLGAPIRIQFDKILVTAAAPSIPESILAQLKNGGRIVIPVGSEFFQDLLLVIKDKNGEIYKKSLGGCIFVKLRGKHGFSSHRL